MRNHSKLPSIIALASEYILTHPDVLVGQINDNEHRYWLKRRPFSKKTIWHALQGIVSQALRLPSLYPTVTAGGASSLHYEAERLRQFAEKNIPVPWVVSITDTVLITEDVGCQLNQHLQTVQDSKQIHLILKQAAQSIQKMHQAGLCHGRPSLNDMTIKHGLISFIDLEENPLVVMSLAQAQARDIWLFLNSATRYCPNNDPQLLSDLFETYKQHASEETLHALKQMVNQLKPLRIVLEHTLTKLIGRDARRAIQANKSLENALKMI